MTRMALRHLHSARHGQRPEQEQEPGSISRIPHLVLQTHSRTNSSML